MKMDELVKDLEARREQIRRMGGAEKIEKQHGRGKLTARERFAAFFDDGVFFEVGMHGRPMGLSGGDDVPADAVVCGFGKADGRMVCAAAYDFTVKGGSLRHGTTTSSRYRKSLRVRHFGKYRVFVGVNNQNTSGVSRELRLRRRG